MGNTDSIPVVSQLKSLVQVIGGDSAGALKTQENFAYNNTFPVVSQIASAGYAIGGGKTFVIISSQFYILYLLLLLSFLRHATNGVLKILRNFSSSNF